MSLADKLKSFEELNKWVDGYLEKVHYEELQLDKDEDQFNAWSSEAYEVYIAIAKLGLVPDLCNTIFLNNFFKTLYFKKRKLTYIDPLMWEL